MIRDDKGPYKKGDIVKHKDVDGVVRHYRVLASHSEGTVIANGPRFTVWNKDLAELNPIEQECKS